MQIRLDEVHPGMIFGAVAVLFGLARSGTVTWKTGSGITLSLDRGVIMGILNVTPDSFSDGGCYHDMDHALDRAQVMIGEGAGIIDIGGESTRPGAVPVGADEELRRTIPVIEALRAEWDGLISIDTSKAEVARMALAAGANIVNDVSGLRGDDEMIEVCGESGCGIVIMHMQGQPRTMQADPHYDDVVMDVRNFFEERYRALTVSGIKAECLCFDPGIGFGKTLEHNLSLLAHLDALMIHGRPLVVGVSRKSFIGRILDDDSPGLRGWPTVALTAATRLQGALIHRVHEVRDNRDALLMAEAVLSGR